MYFIRLLAAICLVLASTSTGFARQLGAPYFESIVGTESLANGVITVIGQDSRGLIWFGTSEGLYSFDGQRFRVFRHTLDDPYSISDDYVRGLMASSDGRLWVATQGGGLSIYDPRSGRFENHLPQPGDSGALPSVAALVLAEAKNHDVWVGLGNAGLVRWDHQRKHYVPFDLGVDATGQPVRTVRALQFDAADDLWIGTGNGLQRLRAGASKAEWVASEPANPNSFARQYVYALFAASDGRIWIGTQSQGAAVLDPQTGAVIRFDSGDSGTSHPWISGFVEPTAGQIWIHTYGGGIDVVDAPSNRIVQRIRSDLAVPGGLALDRQTAPFKDRDGLIWIGTWGAGMQRHNPHNAATFSTLRHSPASRAGLSHATVLSTLPIGVDQVWIGTGGSGIDVLDLNSGVIHHHRPGTTPGSLSDGTIRALASADNGDVWVGTQHGGLLRFDSKSGQFSPLANFPRGPIRQLLSLRSGKLAVGMQAALILVDPSDGRLQRMQLAADRPFTDAVWSLAEDQSGTLWIGTPNALLYWPSGADYPREAQSKLAVLRAIVDLHVDAQGQLWAAGTNSLARLRDWSQGQPRFDDYGSALGLQQRALGQQLVPDRMGRLWNPRAVIDPVRNVVESIGVADGVDIGSVEIGSGSIAPSGLLFFGGTRGLLIIDPARYLPWQPVVPLVLTAIDIDGHELAPARGATGVRMRPGERRLNVEFAALDYSAAASVRYGYRLLGLEQEWIETDAKQRVASYHNLWPGEYQLQVRAQTRGGALSAELQLPITVVAAWWQTPAAMVLAALLLGALIYAAVRARTMQIRRRAQDLEALVERRTRELSQAKSGAEDALLALRGAQRQLVAAEKMASLGQLVAGVAHEINTPVGIAITAASHLQDLAVEGNAKLAENRLTRNDLSRWKSDVEDAARLILSSLTRAGTLIASFKQVSVDQSSGHRRKFRLAEFLNEVQTTMLPSVRRSPHQLQVQCEAEIELDSYPGALFQVLSNLINNALLHALDDQQPGHLRVVARVVGSQLELSFSDDGRGMDADVAKRAFDPFFTTRRGSGGSGLGLHVVHNLVTQLLGGEIILHTAPGQGARFLMHIPLSAPAQTKPITQPDA